MTRELIRRLDLIELTTTPEPPLVIFGEVDGGVRALAVLRFSEPSLEAGEAYEWCMANGYETDGGRPVAQG